jgi:antitoxin component YwqK of YwqJK toxin-antitoxin module
MMNRLYILTSCLIFLGFVAFAQEAPVYFAKNGHVISNPDSAYYYRVINSREGDHFKFTEYHKDGTWIKGTAKGAITDPVYLNDITFYYKGGKVAVIQKYENGRLVKTIGYYPNGILLQVIDHINTWPLTLVAYDADSSGHVHIINGNGRRIESDSLRFYHFSERYIMEGPYKNGLKDGLWKGADERGFTFEEKYDAGKLISGTSKTAEGKKYHYTKFFEYPTFNGNIDKFESHMLPHLKSISDTTGLRFFKPGFLRLSYVINEDGNVIKLTGFKKQDLSPVNLELNAGLPKCNPAKLRGVPTSYPIANNTDFMVRYNFSPFQVDPKFKGATWTVR